MPAVEPRPSVRVFAMSNYILKYGRGDEVKYISHLDFIRMFHRSVRRAEIPFVFSQGFNPHPVMNVAMPLSVGVTADGEYMKVGFDKEITDEDIKTLNKALPKGFFISEWKKVEGKKPDLSELDRADYIVEVETESDIDIQRFMANSELRVMKKSKSGVRESDIRPYIYSIRILDKKDGIITFEMCLACGNDYNLKPQTVIEAMEKYSESFRCSFISVHRHCLKCGDKELI